MNKKLKQLAIFILVLSFINFMFFSGLLCYQLLNNIFNDFGLMLWIISLVILSMNFITVSITNK